MTVALRSALLSLVLAVLALGQPARGEAQVVVELFTSQGCNACPPADRLLTELAGQGHRALAARRLLGLRDTFAQRQFTERQHAYREAWDKAVVYTPQMVVNGTRAVPATEPDAVAAAIDRALRPAAPIEVSVRPEGGMLKCRIVPGPEPVTGTIWIAKYELRAPVEITRGENAGRSFTYRNVVTSLMRMGTWSGTEAEEVEMPHPDPGEGVAVWIQAGPAGRILAAAKTENPAR